MTDYRERTYKPEENIVSRDIAGETILVPIRGRLADLQNIFTLNTVGKFIWQRLDGRRNLNDILLELLDHFDVDQAEAEQDIQAFISQLTESGLVTENPSHD